MTIVKAAIKGGVAAFAVAVMTVGAYAWPAAATTALNVRAGPGSQFQVVDVLQRHERVEVEYCRSSWCFVHTRSSSGWASERYLSAVQQQPRPPQWQRPPNWQQPPPPQPPHWQRPPSWNQPQPPRPPQWQRPPSWQQPPAWQQPSRPGSQVCFNGPNGHFCFGS